ncbi:MAG: hypothetical protein L6R41_003844 [Letrouitia leprolyta]|nr:MAG: hypothetical protein L6R41_003844 [Letrouitia leprolyta]
MLPTPSTSHVDFNRVYEPAEDSFLFLDTLSSTTEVAFLKERLGVKTQSDDHDKSAPCPFIVEVGTGSGVILAFLVAHAQTLLGRSDVLSLGVDINQYACQASIKTVEKAIQDIAKGSHDGSELSRTCFLLASLNADLTSAIRPGTVDILVFNPPYVPTSEVLQVESLVSQTPRGTVSEENRVQVDQDANLLSLSYAGGEDGMEITNRLLQQIPYTLNPERGVAYILLCKQNKPEEVMHRIRQWGANWSVNIVGRSGRQGGWEKLVVIRICRHE